MKPVSNFFSTIIKGNWNPHIFMPEWIRDHFIENKDQEVRFAFPMQNPQLPPRIQFNDIVMFPSRETLELRPLQPTVGNLSIAHQQAIRCIELLKHTPISAVGTNIGYSIPIEDAGFIAKMLNFDDSVHIDSDKYTLSVTELKRTYSTKHEGSFLNLTISSDTSNFYVHFNFHSTCCNADEATSILTERTAETLHSETLNFMQEVYDLTMTEEE